MSIDERVKNTPQCDWPVVDSERSGAGKFLALYGGEHIAATEFVIGAALAQYGCSASDILIGLLVGNLLATLLFALLCAPIGVRTGLTLYTYLGKVVGVKVQKLYNIIFGIGFAAIAALGISVSATAIRRVLNAPIQHEWYPTSIKFVLIVLVLGAVVVIVAANGFNAVSKFSTKCVPWMICLFALGFVCVLPQVAEATGFGSIRSAGDVYRLLNERIWTGTVPEGAAKLGIGHVIAFAVVCNLAVHLGLNDMSIFRYAKSEKYGYTPAIGMFVGHYFAWISAAVMGATAAALLNTDLMLLDSGEVTFTVLGYAGLLGVVIAGWTTANPTIYRVALSFNNVFSKFTYKQMTYIMGSIITVIACFPAVQRAATVINYCGLLVIGMGAVCVADYIIFPKIGYTRYWNLYKKNDLNWAALVSWGLSIACFALLLIWEPIHQNFWFIPVYLLPIISYTVLAGRMGAGEKYPEQEREQEAYEKALLKYVTENRAEPVKAEKTAMIKGLDCIRYMMLACMFLVGFAFWTGSIDTDTMKAGEAAATALYFVFTIIAFVLEEKQEVKLLNNEEIEYENNDIRLDRASDDGACAQSCAE